MTSVSNQRRPSKEIRRHKKGERARKMEKKPIYAFSSCSDRHAIADVLAKREKKI